MKLDKAVEEFLDAQLGEIADTTHNMYRYALDKLTAEFADTKLDNIDRRSLRAWRAKLKKNHAADTVNSYMAVTRRFFNWCIDDGLLDKTNPTRGIKKLKVSKEPKAISPDEMLRMLRHAQSNNNLRNVAIILFLYSTGGRVGGLIGLTMDELDLNTGRARVHEKRDKWRSVYLEDVAIAALRDYIQWQRPRGVSNHVFLSNRKKPFTRQGIWYALKGMATAAGIQNSHCNPHAFRHAFAIGYLQAGGDLSSLSELMGHSSVSITHDYYARWADDQLKNAHEKYNPLAQLHPPQLVTTEA